MRDVNLQDWGVTAHHTYFAHLQSAPDASAVGLVLVQIGDGSEPCIGLDSHANDKYEGHVLVTAGKPVPGVPVQYFRDHGEHLQFVTETLTDANGRHAVRLAPGLYHYRFLVAGEPKDYEIIVKPGRRMTWYEASPEGEILDAQERDIKFVTEELVCQWDNSDGNGFQWLDIVETVAKIGERIEAAPGTVLRQVSAARFARPDILAQIQARGVWTVETDWRDIQFVAAYRNLRGLADQKLVQLKRHDEANIQLSRNVQQTTPTKLSSPEGTYNFLALARAAAVYHAATMTEAPGQGLPIYDPMFDGSLAGNRGASGVPAGFAGPNPAILDQQWDPRG